MLRFKLKYLIRLILFTTSLICSCNTGFFNKHSKLIENDTCDYDAMLYWEVTYYPNGQVMDSIPKCLESGKIHGMMKTFSNSGSLIRTIDYKQGLKHNKEIYYLNGVSFLVQFYKNGIPSRCRIQSFPNGSTFIIDSISNGSIIGIPWIFDSTGLLIQRGTLRDMSIVNVNRLTDELELIK